MRQNEKPPNNRNNRNNRPLSFKKQRALEALNTRVPGETLSEVAERAGVSRAQLHRYMNDEDFRAAIPARLRSDQLFAVVPVFQALVRKAIGGDVQAQREFWRLCGFQDTTTVNILGLFSQISQAPQIATLDTEKMTPQLREELYNLYRETGSRETGSETENVKYLPTFGSNGLIDPGPIDPAFLDIYRVEEKDSGKVHHAPNSYLYGCLECAKCLKTRSLRP